jgi:Ca2+-binding RTX toxin-like protein
VRFDDGESTRQTIGLGPSTLIENATGGEGSDRLIGNHANNQLTGRGGDDVLIGAAGRDVLDGGQGADRLVAGGGNDVLVWQASDIRVDGGEGGDVMRVKSPTLDAAKVGTEIVSIERIDMTGIGTRLYLAGADVLDISGMDDTLAVLGDAGDVVVLRGAFDLVSTAGGFETWRLGAATVKIEVELDVV